MKRPIIGLVCLVGMIFGWLETAIAEDAKIPPMEQFFLEFMQQKHPEFRIVKTPERYPERHNANIPIPITTGLSDGTEDIRALITLHDGKTGEPVESCYAPCTLHKAFGRPAFATAYRYGFHPLPVGIDDPAEMKAYSEFWDGRYKIQMGIDFRKVAVKAKSCELQFAKEPKNDADAKPCFRAPPFIPPVDFSGYCNVAFDLTKTGQTINARILECSDPAFEMPSLITVQTWKYHPKIERGMAVERPNVETQLKYEITDYDGWLLDEQGHRVEE